MSQHALSRIHSAAMRVVLRSAAIAAGAALACAGLAGPGGALEQELVGQPITALRGCGPPPEVEVAGDTETQTYAWVLPAFEPAPERPFGLPSGIPDTLPRTSDRRKREIDAECTLTLEVTDGTIRSAEIYGEAILRDDYTSRCARSMLRCLEAQ
jgi:hypothetical protein